MPSRRPHPPYEAGERPLPARIPVRSSCGFDHVDSSTVSSKRGRQDLVRNTDLARSWSRAAARSSRLLFGAVPSRPRAGRNPTGPSPCVPVASIAILGRRRPAARKTFGPGRYPLSCHVRAENASRSSVALPFLEAAVEKGAFNGGCGPAGHFVYCRKAWLAELGIHSQTLGRFDWAEDRRQSDKIGKYVAVLGSFAGADPAPRSRPCWHRRSSRPRRRLKLPTRSRTRRGRSCSRRCRSRGCETPSRIGRCGPRIEMRTRARHRQDI